jgi:hypothetical protein
MMGVHNQRRKIWWLLAVLLIVCSFGTTSDITAQKVALMDSRHSKQEPRGNSIKSPYVPQQPLDCESFAALVDNAVLEWHETQGTYLIIIVRLGEGERVGSLNSSRLKDVEEYLKRYKSIQYVTAEGSRVKGLGRVELYVGGKLRTAIPVEKNAAVICSGKLNPFM